MRSFVLATLLALAGCTAQGLPLDDPTGGNGGNGGGTSHGGADMARNLGGAGATCKSACDCEPGLACRQGKCGMSPAGAIYCCDEGQCPAGNICQASTGGFSQCGMAGGGNGGNGGFGGGGGGTGGTGGFGGGPGGGADGGLGMFCKQVPCGTNPSLCKTLGCGACTAAGTCGN